MATEHRLVIIIEGRDQASGALNSVGGSLQRIGEFAVGGLLASAIAGIGNALEDMASRAFNSVANIQQLQVSLETLAAREIARGPEAIAQGIGTMQEAMGLAGPKAQELMGQLRDISLISPFEYQDVAETLRLNMAFGLTSNTAIGMTRAILDTAAAMGMNNEMLGRFSYNLAQAIGMGDLTAANLRQLKMVGFDLADVFKSELGMSVEEVRAALESGALTAEQVSQAFMNYAANNFGGAAERLSRTVLGLRSSFNDLFTFAAADLLSPALEVIGEELGGLFDLGREFLESGVFKQIGESLAQGVREAIATIKQVIAAIREWWAAVQQSPLMEKLKPIFDWLAERIGPLLSVKNLILAGLAAIGVAFAVLAGLIVAKLVMITVAAAPWLAIIGAIIAIGYGLYHAWTNNLGDIQEKVAAVGAALQTFGQTIWTLVQEVWAMVEPYLTQFRNTIAAWWEEIAPRVQEAWDLIWNAIVVVITGISNFIQENMDTIVSIFEGAWNVIYGVLQIIWSLISGVFSIFIDAIRGDWQQVWLDVQGIASGVWNGIVSILSGIWQYLSGLASLLWAAIGGAVTSATEAVSSWLQGAWQGILSFFTSIWDAIKGVFQAALDVIAGIFLFFYNAFQGNWDEAWAALSRGFEKAWEDLKAWAETTWNAIVTTATTIFNGLRDTLVGVWDEIKTWFQTKWDEITGWLSGIDLSGIGRNLLQGLWDGLMSLWTELEAWWNETIGWLAEQAEGLLGIQSPSKVFYNIGQNITKGMQLGMQSIRLTPPLPDGATLRGYAVQGSGSNYDQRSYRGDSITVNVTDRDSADYLLAMLEDRRRQRLAAFMGA